MDVRRLLDAVRSELRTTVLPKVEGEYEKSVVVAMLGILGDLRDAVVLDERPIAEEAGHLRTACAEWIASLGDAPVAERLRSSLVAADAASSALERRRLLLEAAETLIRELWSDPKLEGFRGELLPRVRRSLQSRS